MGTHGAGAIVPVLQGGLAPEWQQATVKAIRQETLRVKTFTLVPERWVAHRPGQHYDVRLPGPAGRPARRSYSIASEPERAGEFDLAVERLDHGEVSAFMHEMRPGDRLEVRGPLGDEFVWDAGLGGPLLLVAGGTGITPLLAILRHRAVAAPEVPARLLYSVRSPDQALYADEVTALAARGQGLEVIYTYTRGGPAGWTGYSRRIDSLLLREVLRPLGPAPLAYVCGPTAFVEAVANALVALGVAPAHIRAERFRPTGLRGP